MSTFFPFSPDVYNDIKKLETCEYTYLHLHFYVNFMFFLWVILFFIYPTLCLCFGFKHFISFNHFIFLIACFVPKLLESEAISFFFKQTQESLYNMLQERTETKRNREKNNKNDGEQTINSNLQTTFTRNTSVQTSENDVSKSISIFTFIKGLYNSIIVQIPASISKGVRSRRKDNRKWINKSRKCVEFLTAWSRLGSRGQGAGSFRGFICHFHLRKSVCRFCCGLAC